MSGTTLERSTAAIGHAPRPGASLRRARLESRSHAVRGLPGPASAAANAAVQQERARIARDLHDSVSQTLYAITLGAVRARSLLQHDDHVEVQRVIDDVLQLANVGQRELRALLSEMRADHLSSGGLRFALESLVHDVRARNDLDVRLSLENEPDIPAATREALVLITREALHNVVKHSGAKRVEIGLAANAEGVVLVITDDGHGFDPAAPRPGHFGVQSMCERATAVGGRLTLIGAVGFGTQVRVFIPAHVDRDG